MEIVQRFKFPYFAAKLSQSVSWPASKQQFPPAPSESMTHWTTSPSSPTMKCVDAPFVSVAKKLATLSAVHGALHAVLWMTMEKSEEGTVVNAPMNTRL